MSHTTKYVLCRYFICVISMTVLTGRPLACRYVIAFRTWPISTGTQHNDFILRFEVMTFFVNFNPCFRTFFSNFRCEHISFGCVCAFKPACMHAYIHTYIHTYTHTYIHTCIHTYVHTYIHTCIHTHTHTHTFVCFVSKPCYKIYNRQQANLYRPVLYTERKQM